MKKSITTLAVVFSTVFFFGCGGGGGATAGGTVTGKVSQYSDGSALSGVTVSAGDKSTSTGSDGSYTLSGVSLSDRAVILFKKNGFGSTAKIASLSAGNPSATIDADLLKATSSTFDGGSAHTVTLSGSPASVVLGANALEQKGGTPPDGKVHAAITPIDPAVSIDLMPGDMTDDSGKLIESFGAVAVEFTDDNGHKLNLASGQTATIHIPATTRNAAALPATIPLYYFDEEHGYWKQEGTGTLKSGANGKYYEGTVTHFSYWNGDRPYEDMYIHGCVEDFGGNKISNARITMHGFDYAGRSMQTFSGSDGNFTIKAKQNATSLVLAEKGGKLSDTAKISTGSGDYTLPDCLVIGDAPLKASLTWGKDPSDLDTHVVGPNGFHIWYRHLGTYENDNAKLDVDDTDSYGPEVYTVRKFTTAGTYHYAVYHYAGSSTISASPARVEVVIDGHKTVFTPPSGQGSAKWWNVFNIVVDSNMHASIKTVNTWSAETAGPTNDYR